MGCLSGGAAAYGQTLERFIRDGPRFQQYPRNEKIKPPLPATRYPLLEIGYMPFEPEAANLFFQVIPPRCAYKFVQRTVSTEHPAWSALRKSR